jgi:cytochrome c-type biogenesis protein CcmH
MSLLFLLFAIILLITLNLLILPMIRTRDNQVTIRETYDVAIYKDQLKEADHDCERGLLSSKQLNAVKIEIQRKLINASNQSNANPTYIPTFNPKKITAFGLVLFLSIGSVGIYSFLGSPELGNKAFADRDLEMERKALSNDQAVSEMMTLVEGLEKQLATDQNNLDGWLMLGRSAISLGQFQLAIKALKQALKLNPENLNALIDYAETLIVSNKGQVSSDALKSLQYAHKINAAHPKARYYIALHHAQAGNMRLAIQGWVDLLSISLPNAPWVQKVQSQIKSAAEVSKVDIASIKPSPEALQISADISKTFNAQVALSGPSQSDSKVANEMSAKDRQKMILSMVERLANSLKKNPNNRQGWLRLSKAYEVMGDTEKATYAMGQADALSK